MKVLQSHLILVKGIKETSAATAFVRVWVCIFAGRKQAGVSVIHLTQKKHNSHFFFVRKCSLLKVDS